MQYRDSDNLEARMKLFQSEDPSALWRKAYDTYRIKDGEDILEVGGGTGIFWQRNLDRLPAHVRVTFSDLSSGMIEKAKIELLETGNFTFEIADVCHLHYAPRAFDLVVSHFMLYHAPEPGRAVKELARVLKSDGRLGVILPDHGYDEEPAHIELAFELFPHLRRRYLDTSKITFRAREFAEIAPNFFRDIVEVKLSSTITLDDERIALSALTSLPCFKGLRPEQEIAYQTRLRERFLSNGPLILDSSLRLFICRSPWR